MILQKLSPVSFGRFQNREVALARGVNLIEAPNEAGKSTLAAFVSGMLYGFFRRDLKKRFYAPAFDRYLPWDNPNKYFGAMALAHEGREYRLERNFLKDEVRLIEADTGRDVSGDMPYNATLRLHEPGLYFLGISQTAFEGTLYVPQQAVRTGETLGADLADRIDALSETGLGNLSASGALKWLKEQRENLGTPRRGATPLGTAHAALSALSDEREAAAERRERATEDARKEAGLRREVAALEAAQRQDEALLEQAKRYARWRRAEAVRKHHDRVGELEALIEALPEAPDADEPALNEALQSVRRMRDLEADEAGLAGTVRALDGRIAGARSRAEKTGMDMDTYALSAELERAAERLALVGDDFTRRRDEADAARQALPPDVAVEPQRARALMARCEALPAVRPARALVYAGILLTALALTGFFYPLAFALAAPGIPLLAWGIARNRKYAKVGSERADILSELHLASPDQFGGLLAALDERAQAERALESALGARSDAQERMAEAEGALLTLLKRARMDSLSDYRGARERYAEAMKEAHDLGTQRATLAEPLENKRRQAEALWQSILLAMENAALDAPPDGDRAADLIADRLSKIQKRREAASALNDARQLLSDALDGDDYAALAAASPEPEPGEPLDALDARVRDRAGRIREKVIAMNRCADERERIEDGCRTLNEIDGDMALAREKIDRLTLEAEALDEAKARIERAADDMRRKLSPALSRSIEQVSGRVTGGRYDRLLIDTDLKIQALAADQTLSPDRLSGGTADAIYLALRLGLVEFLMGGKECPVILDDSFAQLDDERASRMLEAVAAFAEGRQALILTCQSRTRRMLAALQIPHNAVML